MKKSLKIIIVAAAGFALILTGFLVFFHRLTADETEVKINYIEGGDSGTIATWYASYDEFTGTSEEYVENYCLGVDVDIFSKTGTVDVYIYDDEGFEIYCSRNVTTLKEYVNVNPDSPITMKVVGHKARGCFVFTYHQVIPIVTI